MNAIEPGSTNNGVVMTLTGMARCFAGILALMQVKSAGAESEKAYQVYDNSGMDSFMFLMHVLLLAAAFACGYRLGKIGAAQPPLAVRGINQGTNTYEEGINVTLHDLTVKALGCFGWLKACARQHGGIRGLASDRRSSGECGQERVLGEPCQRSRVG